MLVDHDPVVDLHTRRFGQAHPWGHTDADDDHVGGFGPAVAEHDLLDPAGAPQLDDPGLGPELDAVVHVQAAEHLADLVAEDPLERHRARGR